MWADAEQVWGGWGAWGAGGAVVALAALGALVLAGAGPAPAAAALADLPVYRMLQLDLHNHPHGCRSSSINLEGRSLTSWSTSRHCVVSRIQDISIDQFMEIRSKAGALLLVLPRNDTALTVEEREHIQLLEMAMAHEEVNIAVYLMDWSPQAEVILADLQHSFITDEKSGTALEAMVNTASANGYQIVVTAPSPQKIESKPITLHGRLAGRGGNSQTIVIAAHYDSSAVAPELAFGADSNGSGTVALLELARIFSRLYSTLETHTAPSLLFVLAGSGHTLNYFSTKKWLEEQLDSADSLLQDVSFAMCLDTLSSSPDMAMHVSKPPRPGGAVASLGARMQLPVNHKKINLADESLAWQHERFSIRRMTAFTVSALQSHKEPTRTTILDVPTDKGVSNLVQNVRRMARALASHIYNLTREGSLDTDDHLYSEALSVDEASVRHWYNYLGTQARAAQLITNTNTPAGVSAALERVLTRYIGDVTVSIHAPDKREPEFALYSPTRATLHVYSVKPAVFDLILTLAIVAYLALVYFGIVYFPNLYEEVAKFASGKVKMQ